MKLKDRLKACPNIMGVEMTGGLNIVRVVFEPKWVVYGNDDESIKVARSEERDGEWFYYGNADVVDIEDIIDLIDQTIEHNESILAKIELLREKIEELKELFNEKSLNELRTLRFEFDKPKKKPSSGTKKGTTRKKKVKEEPKEEEVVENAVV